MDHPPTTFGPNLNIERGEISRKTRSWTHLRRMPPKRTSTSEAPAMTQATIRKLLRDSVCHSSGITEACNNGNANNSL
ncbi:hypothetical protein Tco_0663442 [Tanacetum coccineum]